MTSKRYIPKGFTSIEEFNERFWSCLQDYQETYDDDKLNEAYKMAMMNIESFIYHHIERDRTSKEEENLFVIPKDINLAKNIDYIWECKKGRRLYHDLYYSCGYSNPYNNSSTVEFEKWIEDNVNSDTDI